MQWVHAFYAALLANAVLVLSLAKISKLEVAIAQFVAELDDAERRMWLVIPRAMRYVSDALADGNDAISLDGSTLETARVRFGDPMPVDAPTMTEDSAMDGVPDEAEGETEAEKAGDGGLSDAAGVEEVTTASQMGTAGDGKSTGGVSGSQAGDDADGDGEVEYLGGATTPAADNDEVEILPEGSPSVVKRETRSSVKGKERATGKLVEKKKPESYLEFDPETRHFVWAIAVCLFCFRTCRLFLTSFLLVRVL